MQKRYLDRGSNPFFEETHPFILFTHSSEASTDIWMFTPFPFHCLTCTLYQAINNYWMRFLWLFWISQKPFVLLYIEWKKIKSYLCFLIDGKQHKVHKLDIITLRNHAQWSYMTWLPVTWVSLTWLLCNLQLWRHGCWVSKFTVRFRPITKEIASSIYNNVNN